MSNLENYGESTFEEYKHINEYEQEFWYARDMQQILRYTEWRNFIKVIEKAKIACEISAQNGLTRFWCRT